MMSALKQDPALFWLVDSAFPESMRSLPDSDKSLRFAGPHFDQFLDLHTTQPTGFWANHARYFLNVFLTPSRSLRHGGISACAAYDADNKNYVYQADLPTESHNLEGHASSIGTLGVQCFTTLC